jgi:hypothetical protein
MKSFKPLDCYPVGRGDTLSYYPKSLNFAKDCWDGGEETFLQVGERTTGGGVRELGSMEHVRSTIAALLPATTTI